MSNKQKYNYDTVDVNTLIKYIKGNLLGAKKKEIEMEIAESPLLQEAIEGLKEHQNLDKVEERINKLNEKIAYKTQSNLKTSKSTIIILNKKTLIGFSIAASLVLIGVWSVSLLSNMSFKSNSVEQIAYAEEEENGQVPNNKITSQLQPKSSFTLSNDSTAKIDDTIKTNLNSLAFADDIEAESKQEEIIVNPIKTKEKPVPVKEQESNTTIAKDTKSIVATASKQTESKMQALTEKKSDLSETEDLKEVRVLKKEVISELEKAILLNKEGNTEQAIEKLTAISNNRFSSDKDRASIELAKIYLNKGEKRKAKKLLKNIDENSSLKDTAQNLLESI